MTARRSSPELNVTMRAFGEAFVIAAIVLVVAYLLGQQAAAAQSRALGLLVQGQVELSGLEIDRALERHVRVVATLARVAESRPPDVWAQNAEAAQLGDVRFRALALLDTALAVRRSAPSDLRAPAWLAPGDPVRDRLLRDAVTNHPESDAVVTSVFDIGARGRGVLVVAPVRAGERTRAYVVGLVRVHDLFDLALERARKQGFEVSVHDGAVSLYGPVGPTGNAIAYARDAVVQKGSAFWTVRLWPSDETLKRLSSWGPFVIMTLGLLLAFAVGNIVLLLRGERVGAPDAASAEAGFEEADPEFRREDAEAGIATLPAEAERAGSPAPAENTENPAPGA